MAKEERKLILDMLKEGKITFEEAEKLLDALSEKKEEVDVEVVTNPGLLDTAIEVIIDSALALANQGKTKMSKEFVPW